MATCSAPSPKVGRLSSPITSCHIVRFNNSGILLASGAQLEADIIVTATGLKMVPFGKIQLAVDGKPVNLPDHIVYNTLMVSDIPNFAFTIGYVNNPWTLLARGVLDTLDAIGEQRPVHVVGNSLGGAVAMQIAVLAPARVASLVLVASAGFGREVALPLRLLTVPLLGDALTSHPTRASARMSEQMVLADPRLVTDARVEHALAVARSVRPVYRIRIYVPGEHGYCGVGILLSELASVGTQCGPDVLAPRDLAPPLSAAPRCTRCVGAFPAAIAPWSPSRSRCYTAQCAGAMLLRHWAYGGSLLRHGQR